jgi:dihydroneopterin aldolase/2-amino-4-hydroxy-6-hydroxymethyldihydropteridine diphosphokinase
VDTFAAGQRDDLTLSVDYGAVCDCICTAMTEKTFDLIETAAQHVALSTLHQFPRIAQVEVTLYKPDAPIPHPLESVSVKLKRGWTTAVIALGSNMGESRKLIADAVQQFCDGADFRNVRVSSLLVTKPYGYTQQPDFLNGVMLVDTLLPAHELLDFMQAIEQKAHRTREIHWGPRTLDLDLIFYGDQVIQDAQLIVPHPDLEQRDFVLRPLCEIAPFYRHPISGMTAAQLLQKLERA